MKRVTRKLDVGWKLYSLVVLFFLALASSVFVYAYNSGLDASIMGHDSSEINVTIDGSSISLQDAITQGRFSSQWTTSGSSIYFNDNVGIGTTTPTGGKLNVVGNANFTGSVSGNSFLYSSDKNLKTNIKPLENSLGKVIKLQGVSFDWKSNGKGSVGLIAQDVEKVFPELVSGEDGGKAVEYANLVAVLIEAVKEQQKEIDELKLKLND